MKFDLGREENISPFSTLFSKAISLKVVKLGKELILKLPNEKILDQSKFKAFTDNKINAAKNLEFVKGREKNIVKQERQIVARYARLTPSCKAGACTGQNSSMKNNKGH